MFEVFGTPSTVKASFHGVTAASSVARESNRPRNEPTTGCMNFLITFEQSAHAKEAMQGLTQLASKSGGALCGVQGRLVEMTKVAPDKTDDCTAVFVSVADARSLLHSLFGSYRGASCNTQSSPMLFWHIFAGNKRWLNLGSQL